MTNKVIHVTCAAAMAAALSACAATPTSITPSHVSETRYTHTDCRAIEDEQRRVEATLNQLATKQEQNHTADAFLLTTGMILFWPALLGMAFTKDREGEIAQLMGERNALARAAQNKGCGGVEPSYWDLVPAPATPEPHRKGVYQEPVPGHGMW